MALYQPRPEALKGKGRVTTLGMFIIDHFEVKDESGNSVLTDDEVMGGGGIYAMTAARIFLPPSYVGLLVDKGTDFPGIFADQLEALGDGMVWFRPRDGKTTRAVNIYSGRVIGEGHQTFKYTSPQLHITPKDYVLPPSPFSQPAPEWMHVVCDTTRAEVIVAEATAIMEGTMGEGAGRGWNGRMVWEPLIRRIEPGTTGKYVELARNFEIFSPNLLEMQTILELEPTGETNHSDVEFAAQRFRALLLAPSTSSNTSTRTSGPGPVSPRVPAIVVRAGPMGSYTLSDDWSGWVPAYWRSEDIGHVVDVTGGGNAFLGGLLAGLLIANGDLKAASIYAAAGASFAIEQRGLPRLAMIENGESWNGDSPWRRVSELAQRVDAMELASAKA